MSIIQTDELLASIRNADGTHAKIAAIYKCEAETRAELTALQAQVDVNTKNASRSVANAADIGALTGRVAACESNVANGVSQMDSFRSETEKTVSEYSKKTVDLMGRVSAAEKEIADLKGKLDPTALKALTDSYSALRADIQAMNAMNMQDVKRAEDAFNEASRKMCAQLGESEKALSAQADAAIGNIKSAAAQSLQNVESNATAQSNALLKMSQASQDALTKQDADAIADLTAKNAEIKSETQKAVAEQAKANSDNLAAMRDENKQSLDTACQALKESSARQEKAIADGFDTVKANQAAFEKKEREDNSNQIKAETANAIKDLGARIDAAEATHAGQAAEIKTNADNIAAGEKQLEMHGVRITAAEAAVVKAQQSADDAMTEAQKAEALAKEAHDWADGARQDCIKLREDGERLHAEHDAFNNRATADEKRIETLENGFGDMNASSQVFSADSQTHAFTVKVNGVPYDLTFTWKRTQDDPSITMPMGMFSSWIGKENNTSNGNTKFDLELDTGVNTNTTNASLIWTLWSPDKMYSRNINVLRLRNQVYLNW